MIEVPQFRKVPNIPRMLGGSTGTYRIDLLDENHKLWICKSVNEATFKAKPIDGEISSVVAGGYHCMVLLLDGRMVVFGQNDWGQFGFSTEQERQKLPMISPFPSRHQYSRQKSARSFSIENPKPKKTKTSLHTNAVG